MSSVKNLVVFVLLCSASFCFASAAPTEIVQEEQVTCPYKKSGKDCPYGDSCRCGVDGVEGNCLYEKQGKKCPYGNPCGCKFKGKSRASSFDSPRYRAPSHGEKIISVMDSAEYLRWCKRRKEEQDFNKWCERRLKVAKIRACSKSGGDS